MAADHDDTATRGGEIFVQKFYETYDTARHDLFHFYKESSSVIWNGTCVRGVAALKESFTHLPPTKHTITSFDCQAIAAPSMPSTAAASAYGSIIIQVHGTVQFSDSRQPRTFSQTFVVAQDPATGGAHFYVAFDTLRYV
eukprot:TRINITY_DN4582_c0_g1_i1.p1 TRINITY_DN4582_c0_g1~~TRINITY_DN4582_c0_g1_i1.p1  ORF type:complete len:140 (-),score=8.22 TRINITY_DN4582_c0_g1_i1:48-467(-)